MSDLIRREDAIEVAYQLRHKPNDDEWNEEWLHSFNAIPTIDAVSVVRCKECKFSEVWESTAGDELYCEKQRVCPYDWGTLTAFYVKADDFCSYGEVRDE